MAPGHEVGAWLDNPLVLVLHYLGRYISNMHTPEVLLRSRQNTYNQELSENSMLGRFK